MFGELVDSGRAVRLPLVAGYSSFFAAWLLFFDHLPSEDQASEFAIALRDLFAEFGSGALVALVTFGALTVGGLIDKLLVGPMIRKIMGLRWMPDWDAFIDEAFYRSVRYEEFVIEDAKDGMGHSARVPSVTKGRKFAAEYDDRRKGKGDAEFRLGAAVVLVPVCLGLGLRGGGLWWLAILSVLVLLAHHGLAYRSTLHYMYLKHRESLEREVASLERVVSEIDNPPSTDQHPFPSEEERAAQQQAREEDQRERLQELQSELEALTPRSFRQDARDSTAGSSYWGDEYKWRWR